MLRRRQLNFTFLAALGGFNCLRTGVMQPAYSACTYEVKPALQHPCGAGYCGGSIVPSFVPCLRHQLYYGSGEILRYVHMYLCRLLFGDDGGKASR